jgi:hypothetical protein
MADIKVVTLNDYLLAVANGNKPIIDKVTNGLVADTISVRDYKLNKKSYVAAAEKAGYKLNLVSDSASLADYAAAKLVRSGQLDENGLVLITADTKIASIGVPAVGKFNITVAQYKAQATVSNGYLKAMTDAGNTVGVYIVNPSLAEFKAAAVVRGDTSLIDLMFTGVKKPVVLTGADYLDNSKFVALLKAKSFEITVNVDPAKTSQTAYKTILADKGVTTKLATDSGDGSLILNQNVAAATLSNILGNGYKVKIKPASTSLKDYLASKALTPDGLVLFATPTKTLDTVNIRLADFSQAADYIVAAKLAGFKIFVLVSGTSKAAYDNAVAIVDKTTGIGFKMTPANPEQPATIRFTADDYLAAPGYVTALKNSGYKLAVNTVDASKYTTAQMETLFAKGASVAVIKASAGAAKIDLTGREYSDNLAYVKGMEKAGYSFNVSLDPTKVTVAEYKAILADKLITVAVVAADPNETVTMSLTDYKSKAGTEYKTMLESKGYIVKIKPDSLSVVDFKKAYDYVGGNMDKLALPAAAADAARVVMKLGDFDQYYNRLLEDAGYKINAVLPNNSLDAFNDAKSLIGSDANIAFVMP